MSSTNSTNSASSEASSTAHTPLTAASSVESPPLNLDVKFVDSRWNKEQDAWAYNDTINPDVPAELVEPLGTSTTDGNDDWKDYCFVVVRTHSKAEEGQDKTITFKIVIKSSYLITALRTTIGEVRGISWSSEPLELEPQMLITFFPRLETYEQDLSSRSRIEEEERVLAALRVLLNYMRKNYKQTLARIASLTAHGEITFDLLYAILIPGSVVIRRCPATRETQALRLMSAARVLNQCGQPLWSLTCEGLEVAMNEDDEEEDIGWADEDQATSERRFGMGSQNTNIRYFQGVEKISSLNVFPLEYHSDPERLAVALIQRARKWVALSGAHHVQYRGTASRWEWVAGNQRLLRYSVKSRIMIDKASFGLMDADYSLPQPDSVIVPDTQNDVYGLKEEHLLLASPIVYGFSFSDKKWLEFNVNHVTPITWNDEAFAGLVLVEERKTLLQSLVEAHSKLYGENGFDDFVRGKGQGLVINLFGPPGVGKTLSAEATSEHLRRPLYIIGSGDLGTSASQLDDALDRAFALAAAWNAVLLIDEADVFLEQRSLHDLARNAMVAVFLRHIEYYRGILFLTTNRIKTFDEAFLSRIHVALHYDELTVPTKTQIWRSFLKKAGIEDTQVSDAMLAKLAQRDVNGRQIKNACRTATSLALSRGEKMRYEHVAEALNAMQNFMADFAAMANSTS